MLIDSHCHLNRLDLTEFDNHLDKVIDEARANGVTHMLCVSVERADWPILRQIAANYSEVSFSVGVHPDTAFPEALTVSTLVTASEDKHCVALGETGLDFYRAESDDLKFDQIDRFRAHIQASRLTKKPLIIHTRQAAEETLQTMQEEDARDAGGVMHCFTETWDIAKRAMDLNFYISFSGIVSFKNATALQEVAKKMPLDRILIETDAPYLAPVPYRGKQNHPAYVKHVATALSQLRGEPFEKIATVTAENFYSCFPSAKR